MKVTSKAVIVSCPSYNNNMGKITIYRRNEGLSFINDFVGPAIASNFGDKLQAFENDD